jgi:hypothetical protein
LGFRDGFARDCLLHRRVCKPSVPREIRVTPEHSGGGRPSLLREAEIVPPAMIVAASSASVAAIPAASCAATPPQPVARRQCAARLQTAGGKFPRTTHAAGATASSPRRKCRARCSARRAGTALPRALHLLPQAQRIHVYIASEPLLRPHRDDVSHVSLYRLDTRGDLDLGCVVANERADSYALPGEPLHDLRPNCACAACYENRHRLSPCREHGAIWPWEWG